MFGLMGETTKNSIFQVNILRLTKFLYIPFTQLHSTQKII